MTKNNIKILDFDDIKNYLNLIDICDKYINECKEQLPVLSDKKTNAYRSYAHLLRHETNSEEVKKASEEAKQLEKEYQDAKSNEYRWITEKKVLHKVLKSYINNYVDRSIAANIEILKGVPVRYKKFVKLMSDILTPLKEYNISVYISTYSKKLCVHTPCDNSSKYNKYFNYTNAIGCYLYLDIEDEYLRLRDNKYDCIIEDIEHISEIATVKDIEESVLNVIKAKNTIKELQKQYKASLEEIYSTFIPFCDEEIRTLVTLNECETYRGGVQ